MAIVRLITNQEGNGPNPGCHFIMFYFEYVWKLTNSKYSPSAPQIQGTKKVEYTQDKQRVLRWAPIGNCLTRICIIHQVLCHTQLGASMYETTNKCLVKVFKRFLWVLKVLLYPVVQDFTCRIIAQLRFWSSSNINSNLSTKDII